MDQQREANKKILIAVKEEHPEEWIRFSAMVRMHGLVPAGEKDMEDKFVAIDLPSFRVGSAAQVPA
jgi:hypothetical protein